MAGPFFYDQTSEKENVNLDLNQYSFNVGWELDGETSEPWAMDFTAEVVDFSTFTTVRDKYTGALNALTVAGIGMATLSLLSF